jgi:hypothetical protein
MKQRLGKTLATIGGAIKPVLATQEAAEDDQTGGAMRIEQTRYERQILDFESEIRRRPWPPNISQICATFSGKRRRRSDGGQGSQNANPPKKGRNMYAAFFAELSEVRKE